MGNLFSKRTEAYSVSQLEPKNEDSNVDNIEKTNNLDGMTTGCLGDDLQAQGESPTSYMHLDDDTVVEKKDNVDEECNLDDYLDPRSPSANIIRTPLIISADTSVHDKSQTDNSNTTPLKDRNQNQGDELRKKLLKRKLEKVEYSEMQPTPEIQLPESKTTELLNEFGEEKVNIREINKTCDTMDLLCEDLPMDMSNDEDFDSDENNENMPPEYSREPETSPIPASPGKGVRGIGAFVEKKSSDMSLLADALGGMGLDTPVAIRTSKAV